MSQIIEDSLQRLLEEAEQHHNEKSQPVPPTPNHQPQPSTTGTWSKPSAASAAPHTPE